MPADLVTRIADADDGTIQLDPEPNLAKNSSNFDMASRVAFQEDVRSLFDRAIGCRSSPIEVSESTGTKARESSEKIPTLEAGMVEAQ
ncbi:MAG: hypothetical protein Q9225_005662 [Loekoesia sp. 1 TL-2023]